MSPLSSSPDNRSDHRSPSGRDEDHGRAPPPPTTTAREIGPTEASALLWRCWREGRQIDALPDAARPRTRQAAYAVQALIESRSRRPLAGWKIAATSSAGQSHIGVAGPIAGRLLAEQCHADDARLSLRGNSMHLVEPEFAFRLARDLPPRSRQEGPWQPAEVMNAVASLHPALEVPSSRFRHVARAGEAQIIADNACAHDFVLGPSAPPGWRGLDLAEHQVQAWVGDRYQREGIGANVYGDPARALTWLANELNGLGISLLAGQFVTTGTCMAPLQVLAGERVSADFGRLGQVSLSFEA